MGKWGYLACLSIMSFSCLSTDADEYSEHKSWKERIVFLCKTSSHVCTIFFMGRVNIYALKEVIRGLHDTEQRQTIKSALAIWELSGWYGIDELCELLNEYILFKKTACVQLSDHTT